MKITDGIYIATDTQDLKDALNELQHNEKVDWQSIRVERTTNGCTPVFWNLRKEEAR